MKKILPLGLGLAMGLVWASSTAWTAPRPKPPSMRYHLGLLGFNDGAPYRLKGAPADAILADPGAVVYQFRAYDPMGRNQRGRLVAAKAVTRGFAKRAPSDLIAVYAVDVNRDGTKEILLVPDGGAIGGKFRFGPTLLKRTDKGYDVMRVFKDLRGVRYKVLDIRDLNRDGSQEILIAGEVGRKGIYVFRQLIGATPSGFGVLKVKHVDSIHYLDLNRDGTIEVVVKERVGRRGSAYLWTYIDHLYHWDATSFVDAINQFPRYHDEQTLPALVGNLIDHYDAKLIILMEKVEAIKRVRSNTLLGVKPPKGYARRVVRALALLQKGRRLKAKRRLEDLDALYPYESAVMLALANVHAKQGRWEKVLAFATRVLTVNPLDRDGWWWAGIALTHLQERTSAVACFHNIVRLCGKVPEGLAFLKARRGERRVATNTSLRANIDRALKSFGGK